MTGGNINHKKSFVFFAPFVDKNTSKGGSNEKLPVYEE